MPVPGLGPCRTEKRQPNHRRRRSSVARSRDARPLSLVTTTRRLQEEGTRPPNPVHGSIVRADRFSLSGVSSRLVEAVQNPAAVSHGIIGGDGNFFPGTEATMQSNLTEPPDCSKKPRSRRPRPESEMRLGTGESHPAPSIPSPRPGLTARAPLRPAHEEIRAALGNDPARVARVLGELFIPVSLAATLGSPLYDGAVCKHYLDDFIRQSGNPTDRVERQLLEIIAISSLRVAQLHQQAAEAKSVDAIKVLTGAAARMTAEVRKLSESLASNRASQPKRKPRLRVAKAA